MEVSLEPVRASDEVLRADTNGVRPGLSLNKNVTSVMLGKNASTGIADSSIKRKMARIQVLDRFLRLEALDELHKISINGILIPSSSMPLRQNDVVSLHATSCAYSYKVTIKNPLPPSLPSKRRAHPTSMVDLTEELSCPVCLDLFVEATSLVCMHPSTTSDHSHSFLDQVPCGHTVCQSCLSQLSTVCMTCRVPFQSTIPSLVTDNIIAKLVAQDHFAPDELTNYRQRRELM